MTSILVCGAFGRDDVGDDAVLAAFAERLDGHRVVAVASGPVDVPGCAVVPAGARGVAGALRQVDAVVVGGSAVFRTSDARFGRRSTRLARLRALQLAASAHGIPVALAGVGVGELRSRAAVRLARAVAANADLLVLRDEESAALLSAAGVPPPHRVGADPVWALSLDRPAPTSATDAVTVVLEHRADPDQELLAHQIVAIVDAVVARGATVKLQPWQGAGSADHRLADAVHRRAGDGVAVEVLPRPRTFADAVATLAGSHAVVTLRHHALVAAALARCPILAVVHEPELSGLARRLDQPAVPLHASAAVLAEAAVSALAGAPATDAAVERERRAAHRTMDLVGLVAAGGGNDELDPGHGRLELSGGRPW